MAATDLVPVEHALGLVFGRDDGHVEERVHGERTPSAFRSDVCSHQSRFASYLPTLCRRYSLHVWPENSADVMRSMSNVNPAFSATIPISSTWNPLATPVVASTVYQCALPP